MELGGELYGVVSHPFIPSVLWNTSEKWPRAFSNQHHPLQLFQCLGLVQPGESLAEQLQLLGLDHGIVGEWSWRVLVVAMAKEVGKC